jgi:predicted nucleic acid-binding protein
MIYVLDSSVAIKWVLAEPDSPQANQLRDDFVNGVHELLAPDVFPVEVAHALTRAERRNRIAVGDSGKLLPDVLLACPKLHPSVPLLLRASELSSQMRVGVYDCLYVALAEHEGCELLTADTKLVTNLQPTFPFVIDFAHHP